MNRTIRAALLWTALSGAGAAGCGKGIGDACVSNADCSQNGDRICDRTQTDGYCTIPDCEPDRCPPEAVCVQFSYDEPRLGRRFCMRECQDDGGCRAGYACCSPDDPASACAAVSAIIDATPGAPGYCIQTVR